MEEECEGFDFGCGEGFWWLIAVAVVVIVGGTAAVESVRVCERAEQSGEVGGHDVGDEPGDGFRVQDDGGCQVGRQQVGGEDQVDVELEAGVVECDVDSPVLCLASWVVFGGVEDLVSGGEVVGQDVLFRRLAGGGALKFLDVFVGEGCQEGEVGCVAPEADLGHFDEQGPLGLCEFLGGFGGRRGIVAF